ncbi:1,2-phenylacetyl-CoA epoxidase subunit PaaC [Streptomyces albidoflavus]|jgi:ring-1,2-phenylacetyl-CoA epoxidase subunit PaaC|uniref:Phenylacetate-CoA oxygenase subunit PaaI n=2 Tax=Streptomyces TaxID=1883 RepID=A0A8F6EGB6_9ACTN|nr:MULTISPECIES: 1,2-phenylacetyl-CoA epoxidase subunit PaaC [Streptomyces]MYX47983.1 phenylacetate-CoA oxygenase subunit PaaC [Streptomyces sp. SID8385]KDR62117.1 phenylacetic acid degradation protein [Streptomyces wadayamensis]MBK3382493.1 phenylacetate-CoA oxygenase subunit PaaC [Streptomyces sp. DEF147AK]MBK3388202.1 phenylacetate-CoA oxygenase subunit PaaC [Streptomyces sp. DEF1AK]MCM3821723.1 phenylacetate-CoA oxygenase subunit PaaC [Streptomyces sp. DR3-1]
MTETVTGPARQGTDTALARYAVRLGDDALVLAQQLCGWITRAPTIEEDLALSNIALDLVGHARTLLALGGRLDGTGRTEDDFAFLRTEREFTNALLVEIPDGDFAGTVARQLAYTHHAVLLYEALAASTDPELAAFAVRAAKEVAYHRRHADDWVVRLGLGTAESARRMRAGLERVWPCTAELFEEDALVRGLTAAGAVPAPGPLRERWHEEVAAVLERAGLPLPAPKWHATGGRDGLHTEAFGPLVAELQSVHRQFPGGTW